MSRTDKDAPHRVEARWVPYHVKCQYAMNPSRWMPGSVAGRPRVECDLPDGPPRHRRVHRWRWRQSHAVMARPYSCRWEPEYTRATEYHRDAHQLGVPKWFRDHRWNNPERVRVRDEGRAMRAEYRATGDVTIVATVEQHRHRSLWEWR